MNLVQSFVGLPDELKIILLGLITSLVALALKAIGDALKIDLSGYVEQVATALAAVLVTLIESYLAMIPPAFDNIVATALHLIVLILGALGFFWAGKRLNVRGYRSLK